MTEDVYNSILNQEYSTGDDLKNIGIENCFKYYKVLVIAKYDNYNDVPRKKYTAQKLIEIDWKSYNKTSIELLKQYEANDATSGVSKLSLS